MSALCFQVGSPRINPERDDLAALEGRWANFFGGTSQPMRFLSRTRRVHWTARQQALAEALRPIHDLRPVIRALESVQRGEATPDLARLVQERALILSRLMQPYADQDRVATAWQALAEGDQSPSAITTALDTCRRVVWRVPWLDNYRRLYDSIADGAPMFTIDHYCILWPEAQTSPEALRATLQTTFLLPRIEVTPLPRLVEGRYQERRSYLAPQEPGQPFVRILLAYDIRDWWDFWSWHELLYGNTELALAIDISTMPRGKADRVTTNAYKTLEIAVHGRYAEKDARSERALADVQTVMEGLASQNLHEVAIAIMLQAESIRQLDQQTQQLTDQFGARLKLDVLHGAQGELLKLFSPLKAGQCAAPLVRRNALSVHVAATLPIAVGKPLRQRGVLWGVDRFMNVLVHHDLFGITGTENPHGLILGTAGSGKTVLQGMLALRHAVAGQQVVIFDPTDKCGAVAEAAGSGAAYYEVARQVAINILDPLETELSRQVSQVIGKLSWILGMARTRPTPREFSAREWGTLEEALQHPRIYGPDGVNLPGMDSTTAPLLDDLVAVLRELHTITAKDIADDLVGVALRSRRPIFGERTTLRWDFSADLTCYNVNRADRALLPFIFDHGLASLDRYVRSHARLATGRGLITLVDEFGVLSQIPGLRERFAFQTKEYRNFKASCFTADQNTSTHMGEMGSAEGQLWASYLVNNTAVKLIGRQEGSDVALLEAAYGHLLGPREISAIRTAGPGEFVALFGNEVHHLLIQPTDAEWPFFIRSA